MIIISDVEGIVRRRRKLRVHTSAATRGESNRGRSKAAFTEGSTRSVRHQERHTHTHTV